MLLRITYAIALACLAFLPLQAVADSDDIPTGPAGPDLNAGLQPITGGGCHNGRRAAPDESRVKLRIDGIYAAIPAAQGTTKTFHLTARPAPWALRKDLRVVANTYNGVVPGPALIVNQGDEVVIDYRNELKVPDTLHLHGIHGGPVDMDGVAGISQPMVPPGGTFRYVFRASQPGTFIYHSHDDEAMLDSGLYGAIVVLPKHPRPEERVNSDYIEMVSSWQIQSTVENHFTTTAGREYPATWPIEVKKGDHVRIRWINISAEEWHTMHTHGHDQLLIARDAQPMSSKDIQDTAALGPRSARRRGGRCRRAAGHMARALSRRRPYRRLTAGMPDGLITAIQHYAGTPYVLPSMGVEMRKMMLPPCRTTARHTLPSSLCGRCFLAPSPPYDLLRVTYRTHEARDARK